MTSAPAIGRQDHFIQRTVCVHFSETIDEHPKAWTAVPACARVNSCLRSQPALWLTVLLANMFAGDDETKQTAPKRSVIWQSRHFSRSGENTNVVKQLCPIRYVAPRVYAGS
jgi:hypothetical protein